MSALPEGVWRGGEFERAPRITLPTGVAALDRELPGGGWPTAALSEVLHDGAGIGEVSTEFGILCQRILSQLELLAQEMIPELNQAMVVFAPFGADRRFVARLTDNVFGAGFWSAPARNRFPLLHKPSLPQDGFKSNRDEAGCGFCPVACLMLLVKISREVRQQSTTEPSAS